MEIIIGLVVVAVVAYFVFFRKKEGDAEALAPYKVEVVESVVAEPVAKKAPAKKTATAKKPAVKAKTARKPKAK